LLFLGRDLGGLAFIHARRTNTGSVEVVVAKLTGEVLGTSAFAAFVVGSAKPLLGGRRFPALRPVADGSVERA
jgi:hypothetical protein